jgi:hypothetical protein
MNRSSLKQFSEIFACFFQKCFLPRVFMEQWKKDVGYLLLTKLNWDEREGAFRFP